MQLEINTSEQNPLNWGATGYEEIIQNIATLLRTQKYEVAYDRTLGLSTDFLDLPLQEVIPLASAQIIKVVEEREPRATVQDVVFIGLSEQGTLNFRVVIDV